MTRGLTRVREDIVRSAVSELEQRIAIGAPVGWRDHLRHACYLHELNAERGAIRAAFERSIALGVPAYENAKSPGSTFRTPWDFGQLLGAVASFGDAHAWSRIGMVHRTTFFWPEDSAYAVMADALQAVQSLLRGATDVDGATRVVESAHTENADRETVEYWGPLAASVIAVTKREAATLATQLLRMARHHAQMARHGDLQFEAAGIVALLPLGLLRVARGVNLECRLDSPYVPADLL